MFLAAFEQADARVPEIDEVLDRLIGALSFIDAHGINAGIGIPDQKHDRIACIAQSPDMIEPAMAARVDQHAVDLTGTKHFERLDLGVDIVVRGGKQRAVAALRQGQLDGLCRAGQGGIGNVGQHQTDGLGLAADKRFGDLVWKIVERRCGFSDALASCFGDAWTVAQRERHRVD